MIPRTIDSIKNSISSDQLRVIQSMRSTPTTNLIHGHQGVRGAQIVVASPDVIKLGDIM